METKASDTRAALSGPGHPARASAKRVVCRWHPARQKSIALGDFTSWLRLSLRLSLSLNFCLSTYLSQKVKWFRRAGIHFDFWL